MLLGVGCHREQGASTKDIYSQAERSFQQGELKEALSEVNQGLHVAAGQDASCRLEMLKAEIFIWQGHNQEAVALLRNDSQAPPSDAIVAARRSTLLGIAESNLQQLEAARQAFKATEAMEGSASPEVRGDLSLGEGKLAALSGEPVQAELLFNRALQVAQDHHQPFLASKALGNLGILKMQHSRYADGVDLFNASLAAAREANAQASIVKTTINLGWAYRKMGDFDRAQELFEESEKKAEQLGMLTDQTTSVMNLAIIRSIEHQLSSAERDYLRALALARQTGDQQETVYCLTDLAQVAIESGALDRAEQYNNQALNLAKAIGEHTTEPYLLENKAEIAAGRQDYGPAERSLEDVVRKTNGNVDLAVKAEATLARLADKRGHVVKARTYYVAALGFLEKERHSIGRDELKLSYPANAKDSYSDYIHFLTRQGMPTEAFRVAELQRARTLTEGLGLSQQTLQRFHVTEAQATSKQLGHPILSYWVGPKESYLWMVLPHDMKLFVLPGEDKIRPLVEQYRSNLIGGLHGNDLADTSAIELYRILIGPVERWIKPQSNVTIISDGPLCGLNFETLLVDSPQPHYWIEDVSITNATSAILLAFGDHTQGLRARQTAKSLLLIGDPVSPPSYPPLTHAGDEMRLIKQHFSEDHETVLSGAQATPAAYFKAQPDKYALIHFVAHGTASRVSPLDSAVVLSRDGSSYNLYARDIAASRLHARLVTISACDSAGTRIYSSEGLVGLSWAFLRAGAERVIASLWEVNDAFTPKLMDQLYSEMADGKDPAVALRDAKLTLVHSRSVYSRPFYWAAFVLYQGV